MRDTDLRSLAASTAPCKCCGAPATLYGVVDFHKNCEQHRRKVLELSGIPIYYHRCPQCQFVFTTAFDQFSHEDFNRHIYNDQYILVDPDYREARPAGNAQWLKAAFARTPQIGILDYGGGNGTLANLLRQAGFAKADTYDPFVPEHSAKPADRYDCIVSFEVAEHSNHPADTFAEMNSLLKDDGIILFSTLVQPAEFDQVGLNWWYVGPRNGHVSIYSRKSIAKVMEPLGLNFGSFNDNLHLLFRQVPAFAKHLFGPQG